MQRRFSKSSGNSDGSSSSVEDFNKDVDAINTLFVEAREEIEYALEDSETASFSSLCLHVKSSWLKCIAQTYFNESVEEAKASVDKCLSR